MEIKGGVCTGSLRPHAPSDCRIPRKPNNGCPTDANNGCPTDANNGCPTGANNECPTDANKELSHMHAYLKLPRETLNPFWNAVRGHSFLPHGDVGDWPKTAEPRYGRY